MRRGELLALHWDDVDFEKGMVKEACGEEMEVSKRTLFMLPTP